MNKFCSDCLGPVCGTDACPIQIANAAGADLMVTAERCSVCSFNNGCSDCACLDPECNPDLSKR